MNRLIIIFIIALASICFAQDFEAQLQAAYNNFDNPVVDSLLVQTGHNYENLSDDDKIVFHKFKAYRAFQMGEQEMVQNHFKELISIDPIYTLDPLSTSPKLLTLFDKTKIEYLENQQQRLKILSQQKRFVDTPWRSLLFPGWEQWHRGAKTKAYTWAVLGTITLTGTIQSVVRTQIKHEAYLDETNATLVPGKYDAYNDLYKSQYYWGYSMALVWIFSHIDAVFFTENTKLEVIVKNHDKNFVTIGINIKL